VTKGVSNELTWVMTAIWLTLLIGWLFGEWEIALIGFILLYIGRQLFSVYRFEKWIQHASKTDHPPSSGFWSELSYLVSRKQRSLEKHANLQFYKSEQFQAASLALPDAIVSLNEENQIEWFNPAARKIFTLKHSDTRRKIETLFRHPDFITYLKSDDYSKSVILDSLNSIPRVFSIKIFPYYQGHKLLIVKDIHELYNLAQIRRDFIANASHELRTPLTVLNGYIEVMQDSEDIAQQWQHPLNQMYNQSVRMQSIINDLLTLSSMESETLTEKEKVVNVPQLLTNLEQEVGQVSQGKHDIQFSVESGLGMTGYEEPIKSVLMNLVSNAIRYTPEGGEIKVRWYQDAKAIRFEVEDTGIGIAADHISRLTERFYRVDDARSRDTGGTGLGLAIVKHILERHDSTLEISSQLGKGSTFGCQFSLAKKASC